MKLQFRNLLLASIACYITTGCQILSKPTQSTKSPLPPEVVGTWQAQEDSSWQIVINSNGTLSSAVIPMGTATIRPNKTTKFEMKDGSWSTFKAGDCPVEYNPATQELFVTVKMDKIHIVFIDNVIDGSSIDRLVGPVSADGKTWTVDWISVFDYGPRFPQDINDISAEPLIFKKITK